MITFVQFRCGTGSYAVRVEQARGVRLLAVMHALPEARRNVVGIVEDWDGLRDEPLTVVDSLGAGGDYLLVLDGGDHPFGLVVDDVVGIVRVDELDLGPPPDGQQTAVISGVARTPEGILLVVDVDRLERVLSA